MVPMSPRPSTPPPSIGLLTPPSTGGLSKPDSFAKSQEKRAQSKRYFGDLVREGEMLSEFFELCDKDLDKDLDVQVDDSSDVDMLHLHDRLFAPESQCTAEPATRYTTATTQPEQEDAQKIEDPEPFPFLKLPLLIRTKVYSHLLTIPALICVRQKHTAYHDERRAYLYVERRDLLPGIAYALAQTHVNGFKTRFSRFPSVNLAILRVSREVFTEARGVMYSSNAFEMLKPTTELTPQPDFSIRLFAPGYQRLVTTLSIRIRTFYDLGWLMSGGYNVVRKYYKGLSTLTLILELDSATKGFARRWSRKAGETWVSYVKRLRGILAEELFGGEGAAGKTIPICLDLRVLFSGERYVGKSSAVTEDFGAEVKGDISVERAKREELRAALVETWELFKKGGE